MSRSVSSAVYTAAAKAYQSLLLPFHSNDGHPVPPPSPRSKSVSRPDDRIDL